MNTTTHQTVSLDSKEGKAFLRKVARTRHEWRNEWRLRAGPDTDWHVTFSRTIAGDVGEPDQYVEVRTDSVVQIYGESGLRKAFHDAKPVIVPQAQYCCLSGSDARTAAKLLLDGWRFRVSQSAGSTSSSEYGLAFLSLTAEKRGTGVDDNWDTVEIGSASVFVNGSFVIRGAVQ